jgi:hypothetical protein
LVPQSEPQSICAAFAGEGKFGHSIGEHVQPPLVWHALAPLASQPRENEVEPEIAPVKE